MGEKIRHAVEVAVEQGMIQTKPKFKQRISKEEDYIISRMYRLFSLAVQSGHDVRKTVGHKSFDMSRVGVMFERLCEFFEIICEEVKTRGFDPNDPATREKPNA